VEYFGIWAAFEEGEPTGLGYELDPAKELQVTSKRVDALSEDRVVGVALGDGFTFGPTQGERWFTPSRVSFLVHRRCIIQRGHQHTRRGN